MNVSLLKGNITKAILIFAVPIFFSQLFQTLYNTVDTVLVGYFLGDESLAAMGSTTAIFDLIVGFCVGCGSGFGIITGQFFGADNHADVKKSVGHSFILTIVIAVVLTIASMLSLNSLLMMLNTPLEIFDQAYTYIYLICMGMIITAFYNLLSGLLRAVGDSVTPLIVLAISSVLNVILDVFFILVLKMGVAGAAYATLIAQAISTVVCGIWIYKKKPLLVPNSLDFKPDWQLMSSLAAQGLSMGFMSSIVAIGSVILQGAINGLGTLVIAAHTAARRVYMILGMPLFAVMTSLATFVAQNTGAKQYDRIITGIRDCNRMSIVYCVLLSLLVFLFSNSMIALISGSNNPVVLENGSLYLKTNIPFFFALGILLNLRSSLQGLGKKIAPVISSVIELVGKVLFSYMIIPDYGYIAVCFTEPAVWCFMMVFLMIIYMRLPLFAEKDLNPALM